MSLQYVAKLCDVRRTIYQMLFCFETVRKRKGGSR